MKKLFILMAACAMLHFGCKNSSSKMLFNGSINPLIGDISFTQKFGYAPNDETDETLRIKTHLEYVEGVLRAKDMKSLSAEKKAMREKLLDLLHTYHMEGNFPRNYDYGTRRPCFIDKDGNICAVGYLVEQTSGREAAEAINKLYKYEYIADMKNEALAQWIENSGLTLEECAMIQPGYQQPQLPPSAPQSYASREYAISSALLAGANISLTTVNIMQLNNGGGEKKIIPLLGIASGAGSIILGVASYELDVANMDKTKQNLSLMNIGLGSATMFMGIWNLTTQGTNRTTAKRTQYNLYPYATADNRQGVGFSLVRRF